MTYPRGPRPSDPETLPVEVRAYIRANPRTTVFEVAELFAMNPVQNRERLLAAIDAVRPSPRSGGETVGEVAL